MYDLLELSRENLEQIDYHWFWGLQRTPLLQPMNNMAAAVEELLRDEAKMASVLQKQQNFYQRAGIVRFVYWLYNIDNYTYHSYLLAACKAHQKYLSNSLGQSDNMIHLISVVITTGLAFASYGIYRVLSSAGLIKKIDSTKEASAEKRETVVDVVTVTSFMQPHLIVLGINLSTGDTFSRSDFKLACKKRYLETHPDKGGTDEGFRQVRESVDNLSKIISSPVTGQNTDSFQNNFDNNWTTLFDEIKAKYAAAADTWREVAATWREIAADVKEVAADVKEVAADVKEVAADVKEVAAGVKEVAAGVKELAADLKAVSAYNAETRDMIAQYTAEYLPRAAKMSDSSLSAPGNLGIFAPGQATPEIDSLKADVSVEHDNTIN